MDNCCPDSIILLYADITINVYIYIFRKYFLSLPVGQRTFIQQIHIKT